MLNDLLVQVVDHQQPAVVPGQPAHDAVDHDIKIRQGPLGELQELGQTGQVLVEGGGRLLAASVTFSLATAAEPERSLPIPGSVANQVPERELALTHTC